jgi:hypothetical protein
LWNLKQIQEHLTADALQIVKEVNFAAHARKRSRINNLCRSRFRRLFSHPLPERQRSHSQSPFSLTTREPQRGVQRQELELPFLCLGRGGTHSGAAATTFEIEHPDSGLLNVRPTKRDQAVDPLVFAGGGAQRRRRGERLVVG